MVHISINFFIIQTISSLSIIIFIMINHRSMQELIITRTTRLIILIGLLIKISLPPFHIWIIKISKTINWNTNFLFITWQKIIPIFILIKIQNLIVTIISIFFLITGTLLQFIFSKIKPLIISSSIVHIGWILIPQNIHKIFPLLYLLIYTIIIFPLIKNFKKSNKWKLIKKDQKNNFFIVLNILNLRRTPPLTGFLLKWIIFILLIQQKTNTFYLLILFIIATIRFFIYFQIIYYTSLKIYIEKKTKTNKILNFERSFSLIVMILPFFVIV